MKLSYITIAALLCAVVPSPADVEVTMAELQKIGFLPQDKADLKPEDALDMKLRNPFADQKKKTVAVKPAESAETEESKIRAFFDKQTISGVMKLGEKYAVTLGRLALEPGQIIPHIIPGQTQILRVIRVDEKVLEIGWVEEAGYDTAVPRKILKKIDLAPKVSQLLASAEGLTESAQMYLTDGNGKALLPPQSVFPSPSSIMDNLPPGSDTNPTSVLNDQEQEVVVSADAPPAATPPPEPLPDSVPEATPTGTPDPAQDNSEDSVQPDPDLAPPPPPDGSATAGPPAK